MLPRPLNLSVRQAHRVQDFEIGHCIIRYAKRMSFKKKIYLGDAMREEHTMVFYKGEMVGIICPISKIDAAKERNGKTQEIKTSQK